MILRCAQPDDGGQLLPLIWDHAAFERGAATLTADVLNDVLLRPDPPVHLFVAEMKGLVGYAALTFDYALWHGARTGHLDSLFVTQPCRGLGIGGRLLAKVVQSTREAGAIWLEWQTPRWNTAATNFYLRNGAEILEKERFRFFF